MQVSVVDKEPVILSVRSLGSRGDGVAFQAGETVHIPFTLPGETVVATMDSGRGTLLGIEQASPDRVHPVCSYFGVCGGCALQHFAEPAYLEWKAQQVRAAMAKAGLVVPSFALRSYPVNSRRRAVLTAKKIAGQVSMGYREARSHNLVDIELCPILTPCLEAALPLLRGALKECRTKATEFRIQLTDAANGVDCSIDAKGGETPPRNAIEAFKPCRFIRLTWNGKLVVRETEPFADMGALQVVLPPNAFLQAVQACERDIAAFVLEALKARIKPKTAVCDLFSGLGAFTFPLAALYPVAAFEVDQSAISALELASRSGQGLRPIKAVRRDLFRNPVSRIELKPFVAAVIDPPYQGAEAQTRALAAAQIATVVSVSCNPITFAKDAAILTGAGFEITKLAAFDQFKFTPHVEIAGVFER